MEPERLSGVILVGRTPNLPNLRWFGEEMRVVHV
jgi:hypothetical protein